MTPSEVQRWLTEHAKAAADEAGAEVSTNTPADVRLAFQHGCLNGAMRLESRIRARLAALEKFAAAFADAEWVLNYDEDSPLAYICLEPGCEGVKPDDYDRALRFADRYPADVEWVKAHGRDHQPACKRGAAVAALKETR